MPPRNQLDQFVNVMLIVEMQSRQIGADSSMVPAQLSVDATLALLSQDCKEHALAAGWIKIKTLPEQVP